jgi:hypothetical protein
MTQLPEGMYQRDQHLVPHFPPDEYLYRRVPHELWSPQADGSPIDVDAIEMPDMSVGRSRFAHPEWLRLAAGCEDWAVIGFQVCRIPAERWIDGLRYSFRAQHVPDRKNYPHSEVWAFEDKTGVHVDGKTVLLPERIHLEWRERLLRAVEVFLKSREPAGIREHSPASHRPELPVPA